MGSGVSSSRVKSELREVGPPSDEGINLPTNGPCNNQERNSSPEIFVLSTSLDTEAPVVGRSEVAASYFMDEVDESTDRYLSNCFSTETPHQNSMQPPHSARSEYSEGDAAAAEMFAHTALSLGMDNDDLLFNLMYFNSGENATFGTVMNSVQSETLALHSENNTPYKLKPASTTAISGLTRLRFGTDITISEAGRMGLDCECAVCKDDIENNASILQLPTCQHFFHEECLLRWISLQGWCPVCRAPVEATVALASVGLSQETVPEEIPTATTYQGAEHEDEDETTPASSLSVQDATKAGIPAAHLFEDEEGVVLPVRAVDTTLDCFPSQKYVPEAGRVPGVKQCV